MMRYLQVAAFLLFLPQALKAAPVCQSSLDTQLRSLVKGASEVHDAFFVRNESQIQTSLSDVISQIDCVFKLSRTLKVHERTHLLSMLLGIRDRAIKTKSASGELREAHSQDLFRQMAHMARIYNLGASYAVYFCDMDRSFWLQVGARAQNPVHPETLRSCGVRIAPEPLASSGAE